MKREAEVKTRYEKRREEKRRCKKRRKGSGKEQRRRKVRRGRMGKEVKNEIEESRSKTKSSIIGVIILFPFLTVRNCSTAPSMSSGIDDSRSI